MEGGLVGVKREKGRVGNDVSLVLMYDVLHKILSILKVKNKKYWTMNISIKNIKTGTGKKTQLLRRLATLPEHLGSFLTTHMVTTTVKNLDLSRSTASSVGTQIYMQVKK